MKKLWGKILPASLAVLFGFCALPSANVTYAAEEFTLSKPALELAVGESELVETDGEGVVWRSANESVATVSASGVIKGVGVGETEITAESGDGTRATLPVYVIGEERSFEDNILISVFWPPTAEYMNGGEGDERWEEQYRLMSEAGIDYLCNVTGRDRQQNIGGTPRQENTKETNLKMAYYAHKYGMRVSVADERFGTAFQHTDATRIGEIISEYRNVPGVGGYYILDEPSDPMPFADIYEAIKLTDPSGYAHLNFLPLNWYIVNADPSTGLYQGLPPAEAYKKMVCDWCDANAAAGYPQDYIMFDLYPFRASETTWDLFYQNLDVMRQAGLECDVKTAFYLQSNRATMQPNNDPATRLPTPAEMRFEAMVSLAYGYKQLSYFTWFQPTNRNGENFFDSIVDAEGNPHPVSYEAVKQLDKEIHNLGRTLVGLDSLDVHLNGELYGGQTEIPGDFIFQPMDDAGYTISLMKDKRTARNYVMLVNNDFSAPLKTSVFLNEPLPSLMRISPENGELVPVEVPADGILPISLEAGDGILYALPEGMDFTKVQTVDKTAANVVLSRAESEREGLGESVRAELDAAVKELRNALAGEHCTQAYLDGLTSRIEELLSRKEERQKGCGAVSFAGAAALSFGLLIAAFFLLLPNRRKRAKQTR